MKKIQDIKELPRYEDIVSGAIAEKWIEIGLTEGPRVSVEDVQAFFEKVMELPLETVTYASDAIMAGRCARLLKAGGDVSQFHGTDVPDEYIEDFLENLNGTAPHVSFQDSFLCQHNAYWAADAECYEGIGIDMTEIELYKPLIMGSGWAFYIHESKTCVMSPRVRPELDAQGELHSTEGPVLYGRIYALHGVVLPKEYEWIVKESESLDRKKIDGIDNAEVRRVTIASFPEKYITGEPVQSDDYGDLFIVKDEEDDEFDFGIVRVKNAADEKVYWLRVPPTVKTAHEGVAATFGLTAEQYNPSLQT